MSGHQVPTCREVTIRGLMVDPVTNTPVVLLRETDGVRTCSLWVGLFEASAIAAQIENGATPRPMPHDLLKQTVTALGGTLDRVVIHDVVDGTYLAWLHLQRDGESLYLDARPSDAVALALRCAAPVLVAETLLSAEASEDRQARTPDAEQLQQWLESLDTDDLGKYKM